MNSGLDQITSQAVVLPTGVVLLGALLFLALGLALITAGVRTWFRWRRITRHYGADLPGVLSRHDRRVHHHHRRAA
jgi:hypothetical protein